jgi:hypothetical protein
VGLGTFLCFPWLVEHLEPEGIESHAKRIGANLLAVSGSESGSHMTLRWRELDSNFQFRKEQDGFPGRAICVAQAGQKGDPAFAQLPGIWRMSVEGRGPR